MHITPTRSAIEVLESRIAPATVTATLLDGALTLTDDGAGADVTIRNLDGFSFELVGAPGTVFHMDGVVPDSDHVVLSSALKSISATFGAGNDSLNLVDLNVAGNVTIDGGNGTNEVGIQGLVTKGSLSISGGTGDDSVEIIGASLNTKNDLVLTLGDGENSLEIQAPLVKIGKEFTYTGGAGEDNIMATFLPILSVGQNVSISVGAGSAGVMLNALSLKIGNNFTFDSSASLTGESVNLQLGVLTGKVIGDVKVTDGAGNLNFAQFIFGKNGDGKIDVVTGAGTANVNVGSIDLDFLSGGPGGGVTIDASASSSTNGFIAFNHGGLNYTGGNGQDTIVTLGTGGGSLTADLGDGTNNFTAIALGADTNTFKITGGADQDTIIAALAFGKLGSIDIETGSGADQTFLAIIDGSVTGAISVTSDAPAVGTSTSQLGCYFLQAAIDGLDFTSAATTTTFSLGGDLGGTLPIPIGTIGLASGLKVKNNIHVATAGGDDSVEFETLTNVKVGKSILLELGDGANGVTGGLVNFSAKKISVTGGAGADTVNLSGSNSSLGAVNLDLGAGNNTAGLASLIGPVKVSSLNFSSTSGVAETDSLTLARIQVAGKTNATFGAGTSTFLINDSILSNTLTVDTGAGADTVSIDTGATNAGTVLMKAVSLILGEGDDVLNLGGNGTSSLLTTKSTFTANGGAGSNTLDDDEDNVYEKEPEFTNFQP